MASSSSLIGVIQEDAILQIAIILIAILAYPLASITYNLYFHPLSRFPGPKLWAASRIPYIYALLNVTLVKQERNFHEKYGDVIRVAPDEISFASEEAWRDIYTRRKGHKRAPRDKTLYIAPEGTTDNIIITADSDLHTRVRSLLANSFTAAALRESHPLIHGHCHLLVQRFKDMASQNQEQGALVDMTDWMTFFMMDVIGDLALGESFGCLEKGEYHDWVRQLFEYVKWITFAVPPRYYSISAADFFSKHLLPRSVIEGQQAHKRYADERINRRLDSKNGNDRPDFVAHLMKHNADYGVMSREEILSTLNFVILGATETTATPLIGIFNHLSRRPEMLARLSREIRDRFQKEEDIVMDAMYSGDLPYLEAVINEALRMCNPLPTGLPRRVPEGGDTYAGVFLPGGTRLRVQTFTVCRSLTYFYEPDTFHPERWLPKGERAPEFDNDHLTASKPFGTGFSACLGSRLALGELRLIVSQVLWSFDISEDPQERVDFDDFAMPSFIEKGPMRIRIKLRDTI